MTASSNINTKTNLNGIHETRRNFTVEDGNLLVGERSPDRETHAHHKR